MFNPDAPLDTSQVRDNRPKSPINTIRILQTLIDAHQKINNKDVAPPEPITARYGGKKTGSVKRKKKK